ncbi:MAG: hypothetical protein MI754_12720 [Chromatiales bacterium]|nr:hypothetical protein [Chromatiales bacterium]
MGAIKILTVALMGALLTACSSSPARYYDAQLAPGSTIELLTPLELRRGHSRVFIQDGTVVKRRTLDRFSPFCGFEVRQLAQKGDQIEPEQFTVTRIEWGDTLVVWLNPPQFAATNWQLSKRFSGESSNINRYYHYYLSAKRQTNVIRLSCYGAEASTYEAELPTLSEIRTLSKRILNIDISH